MSTFELSTQYKHWTVTVEEQRRNRLRSYLDFLKSKEENTKVGLYSPLSPCGGDAIDESSLAQDIREVSMEQSEVVLQYFCELLRQHCGPGEDCAIKASWRLPNTAVVYFRRFYLRNCLFSHDPRVLLVACLLLAGKTEEEFVAPSLLMQHINPSLTDTHLQAAEEVLLQGLGYDLQVYHPHSCMHALLADIKARLRTMNCNVDTREWESQTELLLNKLLNSELCLTAVPMSMAVAALLKTEPTSLLPTGFSLATYLQEVTGGQDVKLMIEVTAVSPCFDQVAQAPEQVKGPLKYLASQASWSTKKKDKGKKKSVKVTTDSNS